MLEIERYDVKEGITLESKTLINKLFTVNSINQIIFNDRRKTLHQVIDQIRQPQDKIQSNEDAFDLVYHYMGKHHRNEYFYKNMLLNKILLGRHSVRTATALKELPVGTNILDFLIINGTGQVYEIKTELDNLTRLNNQLTTYYKAFSYCNVVTDAGHVQQVINELDMAQVGIIVLTRRNTLHVVRKATAVDDYLNHEMMFKVLRKSEFEHILLTHFGYLPNTTQVQYYSACFALFEQLDLKLAQNMMLAQLKKRTNITRHNQTQFKRVPKALKQVAYFSQYTDGDYARIQTFLAQAIGDD